MLPVLTHWDCRWLTLPSRWLTEKTLGTDRQMSIVIKSLAPKLPMGKPVKTKLCKQSFLPLMNWNSSVKIFYAALFLDYILTTDGS